jgi:hypothetical protein
VIKLAFRSAVTGQTALLLLEPLIFGQLIFGQ